MDRSIKNAVDGGGGSLTDTGKASSKAFSGGGLKENNSNHGRWTPKAACGECLPRRLRMLSWFPILGWALSVIIFTFVVHAGFRSGSCSPRAFIANITGKGEVNNINLHFKQEKQEDLGHDCRSKQEREDTRLEQKEKLVADGDTSVQDLSYCDHPSQLLTLFHLFKCAIRSGRQNELETRTLREDAPPPRVAFLFLSRGGLPLEPLWRRFFEGHEKFYSIYVHTRPEFSFKNDSFFYEHQVPSETAKRFDMTLVDAAQRLLAHAILDPIYGATNSWFVLACESTIPIRSFKFTYNYLMESQHSFVDSFKPHDLLLTWFEFANEKPFPRDQARKGEMWWAMKLRHALMVLEDWDIYYKYKRLCTWYCAPDEQYIPTLLGMKDPQGIENRTVYYVHWEEEHHDSPHIHEARDLTADWFRDIRSRTIDRDGQYHDSSLDAQQSQTLRASRSCTYNGAANSTCFLFARKVSWDARGYLESLPESVLEY